ncbi:uncharacterized protein LOC128267560 [Anopheles cruzii]|uniref:uncharacterized protein LOC128267560 n=1 Tax=Anopheles cruzii TaxID=68878 RepID=UPI0022EC636B|nr:uncharacterized protein LOC128267560 [Anopheles cruzii]
MANFNWMPNEILELIFENLDFRTRRNLSLVCRRWNNVLLSERFIERRVLLAIDGNRPLNVKHLVLERRYPNVKLQFDSRCSNETFKALRVLLPVCVPAPTFLCLHTQWNDPRWTALCEDQLLNLRTVAVLHLIGSCKADPRGPMALQMDELRTLKLEVIDVDGLSLLMAPKLSNLSVWVQSERHVELLRQFVTQLHTLHIVFNAKESFSFYRLDLSNLRRLAIDRRLKGMTKSEQNASISFFRRLVHLRELELIVKFIDSYVLHTMFEKLTQLEQLSLQVSEGTIELVHIAKLTRLKRLRVGASRINLQQAALPALRTLVLGSPELETGTYLEGIECLMAFTRLHSLSLVNVKIYPEVLQLTPTYAVERMLLSNYRRLEETHLLIFVKRFPALRWLRISHCHGVHQREIDKMKRTLPRLAVAFDEAKSDRV